jgi:adenosylcobinamide kinase / adenosylcobinamide-phosphate guanylyltransferase
MIHLILGGQRSGKSSFAEKEAEREAAQLSESRPVCYIATSESHQEDGEMSDRILRHIAQRPTDWHTIEAPLLLAQAINDAKAEVILVDCLTLWLSNCLYHYEELHLNDLTLADAKSDLLACLKDTDKTILLVSNEVGQGVIPMNKLAREFVDQAGWLHQAIAQIADRVSFVTAGLVQTLK